MPRGDIDAGTFIEMLEKDPEYQARMRRLAEEREARQRVWRLAAQPIIDDLAAVGVMIDTPFDLFTNRVAAQGVDVLVRHIAGDYPDQVRECVGRGLATPAAARHVDAIVEAYCQETGELAVQGWAQALLDLAGHVPSEKLVRAIEFDRQHGRVDVLEGFLRTRKNKAVREVLAIVGEDPRRSGAEDDQDEEE